MKRSPKIAISLVAVVLGWVLLAFFLQIVILSIQNELSNNGFFINVDTEVGQLAVDTIPLVVALPLLVFGLWTAFKRLHITTHRKTLAVSVVIGTTLTALSLLDVSYTDAIGMPSAYLRGFPLNWIATYESMGPPWITGFGSIPMLLDVLFWMGLAYTCLSLTSKIMTKRRSVHEVGISSGPSLS